MYAGPGGHRGEFTAWDPVAKKARWTIKEEFPVWSGAVVTAGDVVFYGTMDGWFKAVDAEAGEELWQFKTGSGIIGQPMTYRGTGRQAIRRDPVRRRRLGRRDRRRRSRPARRHRGARLRQRDDATCQGRRPRKGGTLYVSRSLSGMRASWRRCCERHRRGAHRARELRVCADPNNLPFSNDSGRRIRKPHRRTARPRSRRDVEYTWWAQRRGFVRNTLQAGDCDLVIGRARTVMSRPCTTRPYYRSHLCIRIPRGRWPAPHSLDDPMLAQRLDRRAS